MEELLWTSLGASLVSAGLSQWIARLIVDYLRERVAEDPDRARRAARLAAIVFSGLLLIGAAFGFYYFAEDIVRAALSALNEAGPNGPVLLAGFGIVAGVLLFILRKLARIAYGALEIIVAIIGLAGYPAPGETGGIPWLISLLALIYILVRGLDNVDVGIKERRQLTATPA